MSIEQYMQKSPGVRALRGGKKDKEAPRSVNPKMAAVKETPVASHVESPDGSMVAEVIKAVVLALSEKLSEISDQISDLKTTLSEFGPRMEAVEHRVSALEDGATAADAKLLRMESLLAAQDLKLEDLEGRSRRNNIRLVGFPENIEEKKLVAMLTVWIPEALKLPDLKTELIIERAHRLGRRNDGEARPRVVIARILNFAHKQAILQAFRNNQEITYESQRIRIFQDYSLKVSQKRREFVPICTILVQKQIRFVLQFPARLRIWNGGSTKVFDSAVEAQKYVATLGV